MAKLMLTASTRSGLAAIQSSVEITCEVQAMWPVASATRMATIFAPGAMPPLPAMTPATPVS